jgi:hypothetical protein
MMKHCWRPGLAGRRQCAGPEDQLCVGKQKKAHSRQSPAGSITTSIGQSVG